MKERIVALEVMIRDHTQEDAGKWEAVWSRLSEIEGSLKEKVTSSVAMWMVMIAITILGAMFAVMMQSVDKINSQIYGVNREVGEVKSLIESAIE